MADKREKQDVTDDERAEKVDAALREHRRVKPLAEAAARHVRQASAAIEEIKRIEGLARG